MNPEQIIAMQLGSLLMENIRLNAALRDAQAEVEALRKQTEAGNKQADDSKTSAAPT